MYDSLLTSCVAPKYISWDTPTLMTMDIDNGDGVKGYTLQKGAIDFLHGIIGVKSSTSKELFKKSPDVWKQFKEEQLAEARNMTELHSSFSLDKSTVVYLVTDSGDIADISDFYTDDNLEDFKIRHQSFKCELTSSERVSKIVADGSSGLYKFICYRSGKDIFKEDYVPIVILELNNAKSTYMAYNGIITCKMPEDYNVDKTSYTIVPSINPNIDDKSLVSFILRFDMSAMMDYADEKAEDLYNSYCKFQENPVEISARELTSICKKLGYKLELSDEDSIVPFDNMADEDSIEKIQEFYDTFKFTTGETAYDILQMSDLKRAFRYNKLTLLDVLTILSKEYVFCSRSKVNADILSDIVYKLSYDKNMDKVQSDDVKNDIM